MQLDGTIAICIIGRKQKLGETHLFNFLMRSMLAISYFSLKYRVV